VSVCVVKCNNKMTVIFGKAHDLTNTDVGYKLNLYSNVARSLFLS
jgi:hypothetical protein